VGSGQWDTLSLSKQLQAIWYYSAAWSCTAAAWWMGASCSHGCCKFYYLKTRQLSVFYISICFVMSYLKKKKTWWTCLRTCSYAFIHQSAYRVTFQLYSRNSLIDSCFVLQLLSFILSRIIFTLSNSSGIFTFLPIDLCLGAQGNSMHILGNRFIQWLSQCQLYLSLTNLFPRVTLALVQK